jgi:hypothetical protein
MHQHVDAQFFLLAHGQCDLGAHLLAVAGGIELAALEGGARGADVRGLRERADGGSGQRRQREARALHLLAHRKGRRAGVVAGHAARQAQRHFGAVHTRAGAARGHRCAAHGQFAGDRGLVAIDHRAQHAQLIELFDRECEPRLQLGVELRFGRQAERHMQQRARRRDPEFALVLFNDGLELGQRRIDVGAPDVAAIDHAHRQHLVRGQPVGHAGQFLRRAHRVHMQASHRQLAGQAQVLGQRREVRGQQQLGGAAGKLPVGALEGIAPRLGQVEAEDGFVDLHPFHALLLQPREHLLVNGQQRIEQREAVEARLLFLAQVQEAQRPEQHGLDRMAGLLRLRHFIEQARRRELELRVGLELGHEVVVVGVEPLGHLEREGAFGAVVAAGIVHVAHFVFHAARHLEVTRKFGLVALEVEACRLAAEQLDVVGHVVVVGEVAHGDEVEPRIALGLPVARAQRLADGFERGAVDLAAPVLFEGELQFPVSAHARKAEGVGTGGHLQVIRSLILGIHDGRRLRHMIQTKPFAHSPESFSCFLHVAIDP